MTILRVVLNGLIMLAEVAAVAGTAWLGFSHPFAFAALTALMSFALGLSLEARRLRNELPFYFERTSPRMLLVPIVGFIEALMKGVLAGLAALFTFSGTDPGRLYWVAVVFGATVFAGSSLLRVLSISAGAHPTRWGYFRLGPPLGLLFSAGLAALGALAIVPRTTLSDIGWKIMWELPPKPSLAQVSELFYQLKQAFDDFIVTLLSTVMARDWAEIAGVLVSVNVLAGFVAALYAALIAEAVRSLERRLP
jgi:hypothetical protein